MTALYEGAAFQERFGPWAVVAGGSDGIGAAFAGELARRGLNVAAIARRAEPLEALCATLQADHGVQTRAIQADLTGENLLDEIAAATADLEVGLFVYNAGASSRSEEFLDAGLDYALSMMNLNCRGPILLGHHFGARLRERGRGGLVFMSSLACLAGTHYQAIYSATKSFDTILAEGLWHELTPKGVDVLGVLAGSTKTESVLHASDKFKDAMDPAEVARGALDQLGRGPTWIPGETNQATARGMWPLPRVALINGMSQATAELFDLEHTPVEGREFHE
jgi:short-subunit dehydrogenase